MSHINLDLRENIFIIFFVHKNHKFIILLVFLPVLRHILGIFYPFFYFSQNIENQLFQNI